MFLSEIFFALIPGNGKGLGRTEANTSFGPCALRRDTEIYLVEAF